MSKRRKGESHTSRHKVLVDVRIVYRSLRLATDPCEFPQVGRFSQGLLAWRQRGGGPGPWQRWNEEQMERDGTSDASDQTASAARSISSVPSRDT